MKRYDTLPDGVRGVYLRVMRSLGNQLTARGVSGIRSAEELGFIAERVGRIPREGELGIFSIAKAYRGVFERIAEDDFRAYVINKRLLQTKVVGFDGDVVSSDMLDLSGFDESDEVDDSVEGCDVGDGFEDVETVEDEDSLEFEDVEEDEDEDSLEFEDVEEEDDEDSLEFEDVEEEEDEDSLEFEDVEEEEDEDSLEFEDVEEEEDEDSLEFEDVEEEDDAPDGFEELEFEEDDDDEDEEEDGDDDEGTPHKTNTVVSSSSGTSDLNRSVRRPPVQQPVQKTPPPGISKDWSRIRGVEGNESMETVLSGVESLFSKLRGQRS